MNYEMQMDDLESEAMTRFYRTYLVLEDAWKWIRTTWRWRNYLWWQHCNRKRRYENWPPIHAGMVWESNPEERT